MSQKLLVVVNAWGGGQSIFEMLLPYWEDHNLPIIVACPWDSQVETKHDKFLSGPQQQAGAGTFTRWRNTMAFLNHIQYDGYVIFEYDSVCLDPVIEVKPGLRGLVADPILDEQRGRFMCDKYAIYPYTMGRETVERLYAAMSQHPEIYEDGYDDRLLCAWAKAGGVELHDHDRPFHAPGGGATITPGQFPALRQAVLDGACWIHGIKHRETLDVIEQAMKERKQ